MSSSCGDIFAMTLLSMVSGIVVMMLTTVSTTFWTTDHTVASDDTERSRFRLFDLVME